MALLILTAFPCSHFRREYTWCDAVDSDLDVIVGDLRGKYFRKVDSCSFAGIVSEMVLGRLDDT